MVTGADGFLGYRLHHYFENKDYEVNGIKHNLLDLTCESSVKEYIGRETPDIVIHCAAISDVGTCAKNPEDSSDVNVNASVYVAEACQKAGTKLIFCSSDQVYFGSNEMNPHVESEVLMPPHIYGKEKLEAEEKILKCNPDSVCLRLSWMYDTKYRENREHSNLYNNVKQAFTRGEQCEFPVYDRRSITNVWDVIENMEKVFHLPAGIYNYGSENQFSTYELIRNIWKNNKEKQDRIHPNKKAFSDQPRNLMMDCNKIRQYGIEFPRTSERMEKDFWEI